MARPKRCWPAPNSPPPIIQLAHHFNWRPIPLTIKAGRRFATHLAPPPTMPPAAAGPLPPAGPPLVDIQKVWFSYNGHEALRGVSLRAQAGEFIALMGRNGAGKSTLLKHVVGLLKPNRGRITVAGFDTRRVAAQTLAQTVGFVPQNSGRLLFKETLAEEMEFSRRAHQHHANGHAIAGQILTELGLSRFAGTHPRDLSVGERQRAALATILVGRPRLLLLDEPTRGLDYHNKQTLIAILKRLQAQGVTIVMATHDVELVAQCAGRVIIMGEGQVVVDGPVREVMSESMVFSSQINKLFKNPRFLTVADVMQVYA
ncbi:MAG: energy-coupling factor ABC transporter ATP-binding protein [Anaerolineae bacterium]